MPRIYCAVFLLVVINSSYHLLGHLPCHSSGVLDISDILDNLIIPVKQLIAILCLTSTCDAMRIVVVHVYDEATATFVAKGYDVAKDATATILRIRASAGVAVW